MLEINKIIDLIINNEYCNQERLNLIASENAMSVPARLPFLSDIIHRYCFDIDSDDNWFWPGRLPLAKIERKAIQLLKELFNSKYVNLKPISGINCMTVVLSAFAETKTTMYCFSPKDGGHGSTAFIAKKFGFNIEFIPFDAYNFTIDFEKTYNLVNRQIDRKLVYLDQFMFLFPHNIEKLRKIFGDNTIICYDGSHVMGLIAGHQFQQPLVEGADILCGSTHKSFPGPHKGIILTNCDDLASKIDYHSSYFVSQHHPADVAALAISLEEMKQFGKVYASQVILNAQTLGNSLVNRGFNVSASHKGCTASHQIWLDISNHCDPFVASQLLLDSNLVVNAIEIPYITSKNGLRLGVQEVTRLGMNEEAMVEIANVFEELFIKKQSTAITKEYVKQIKQKYITNDTLSYCVDKEKIIQLLKTIVNI